MPRSIIRATAACFLATSALAQTPDQPAGPRMSSIGYPTVAAALDALKARGDVKISSQDGWTVAEDDRGGLTLWSFPPPGHPAYPSAVKRAVAQRNGAFFVDMNVLCQSTQAACDKLVADFKQLNQQMRESIARSHQPRAPGN